MTEWTEGLILTCHIQRIERTIYLQCLSNVDVTESQYLNLLLSVSFPTQCALVQSQQSTVFRGFADKTSIKSTSSEPHLKSLTIITWREITWSKFILPQNALQTSRLIKQTTLERKINFICFVWLHNQYVLWSASRLCLWIKQPVYSCLMPRD